ncbi:MAG: phosphoribosyltransferase [Alteromonadales bacterium]|nr:phosphoribosyltransferase [Alteromonadales bacterium]
MGFVVNNGLVSIDHTMDDFGITTPDRNPSSAVTLCKQNKMNVFSIFRRYGYRGSGKPIGDNCPFIYGLKGKRNLYVNKDSIRDLSIPMKIIISKLCNSHNELGKSYDLVIPMPSSHLIAKVLATRITRKFQGSVLLEDVFRKSTSEDIRVQINNKNIPHGAKTDIFNAIQKAESGNKAFSLSDVKTQNRIHIQPISMVNSVNEYNNILLVDDLFATGRTLITAKDLLMKENKESCIDALCLFSPLNGNIRKKTRHRK